MPPPGRPGNTPQPPLDCDTPRPRTSIHPPSAGLQPPNLRPAALVPPLAGTPPHPPHCWARGTITNAPEWWTYPQPPPCPAVWSISCQSVVSGAWSNPNASCGGERAGSTAGGCVGSPM